MVNFVKCKLFFKNFILKKRIIDLFVASVVRMKTILSNQTYITEVVDIALQECTVSVRDLRRTLWKDFSHISVEVSLSLERKKQRCSCQMVGEQKETNYSSAICRLYRT